MIHLDSGRGERIDRLRVADRILYMRIDGSGRQGESGMKRKVGESVECQGIHHSLESLSDYYETILGIVPYGFNRIS